MQFSMIKLAHHFSWRHGSPLQFLFDLGGFGLDISLGFVCLFHKQRLDLTANSWSECPSHIADRTNNDCTEHDLLLFFFEEGAQAFAFAVFLFVVLFTLVSSPSCFNALFGLIQMLSDLGLPVFLVLLVFLVAMQASGDRHRRTPGGFLTILRKHWHDLLLHGFGCTLLRSTSLYPDTRVSFLGNSSPFAFRPRDISTRSGLFLLRRSIPLPRYSVLQ